MKKVDAKNRIFSICLDIFKEKGKNFSSSEVSRLSPSTNKETVIKYHTQFMNLVPFILAMPNSSFGVWEALNKLDKENQLFELQIKDRFENKIFELKAEVTKNTDRVNTLNDEIDEKKQTIQQLTTDNTTLSAASDKLANEYEAKIKTLNSEYINICHEKDKIIEVNEAKFKASIDALQSEIALRTEQYQSLMEQSEADKKSHLERESALKNSLDQLNASLTASEKQIVSVESALNNAKSSLLGSQKLLEERDASLKKMEESLSQLGSENTKLVIDNKESALEIESLKKECESLQEQLNLAKNQQTPSFTTYINQFKDDKNFKELIEENKKIRKSFSKAFSIAVAQYENQHNVS